MEKGILHCSNNFFTANDIEQIVKSSDFVEHVEVKEYTLYNASDKMLGFLAEYWRLRIELIKNYKEIETLNYFIKAVSRSNVAKANMVRDMKLFEKEIFFYTVIKEKIKIPGVRPWSAKLMASFNDVIVFEDLNAIGFTNKNKFTPFDENHTKLALQTLARFHASCIIYEDMKSKQLDKVYSMSEEYGGHFDKGGYKMSDAWYIQCMIGALETVKSYSKYKTNKNIIKLIESRWKNVWENAINLSDSSSKYRNVICHCDLWNNNILFKYEKIDDKSAPVECVLVDFQAIRYQPPSGDVMLFLYCNLDKQFREDNMIRFLNYYHQELNRILATNSLLIDDILPQNDFITSCYEQKLWGLIVSACLVPQFWIDDKLTTEFFCDTTKFQEILTIDKATFVKTMIETNSSYKNKVIPIFEEIVEQYCLEDKL